MASGSHSDTSSSTRRRTEETPARLDRSSPFSEGRRRRRRLVEHSSEEAKLREKRDGIAEMRIPNHTREMQEEGKGRGDDYRASCPTSVSSSRGPDISAAAARATNRDAVKCGRVFVLRVALPRDITDSLTEERRDRR